MLKASKLMHPVRYAESCRAAAREQEMRAEQFGVVSRGVVVVAVVLACGFAVGTSPRAPALGAAALMAEQDAAAVEAALGLDRPTRRLIQQGLGNEGFDPGTPDGLFGPRTRDAIRRWQAARGLPATGHVDSEQAGLLRAVAVPSPVAESAGAPARADCEAWNTEEFFETATVEDVTACLAAGTDVAARDDTRHTPLHWAAWSAENPAVLEPLLSAGADLAARNENGFTPALLAARHNGNAAVVQLLVAAEADLGVQPIPGREGDTPAAPATDDGQLSPDILLDSYLLRAEQSVRDGDRSGARAAMQQLVALRDEHELRPAAAYHYRYASVWNAVGAWERALAAVRRYLQLTGREGEHYLDALTVMNTATAAIDAADRERERRAAEEARRRAAAERARAEAERQLNAARAVLARMEFVRIPAGQFRMSPSTRENMVNLDGRYRRAGSYRERRDVHITRPFEMGRYEVTASDWETVMGSLPPFYIRRRQQFGGPECDRCPIVVSWDMAQQFISLLNSASGNLHAYRLPTEAEWEYAARAGENRERFVRDVDEFAWHDDNSGDRLHAVGLKRPNGFGLYDMIGNVWEWVRDVYGYYPGGTTVEDPQGPRPSGEEYEQHVARGCSYWSSRAGCERQWRNRWRRDDSGIDIGFRLVRTAR